MAIYKIKRFNEIISAFNNPNRKGKRNDVPEYWDIRKWDKAKILISKTESGKSRVYPKTGIKETDRIIRKRIDSNISKIDSFIKTGYIYVDPKSENYLGIHYLSKISTSKELVYSRNMTGQDRYNYRIFSPVFIIHNNTPYICFTIDLFSTNDHTDQQGNIYINLYSDISIEGKKFNLDKPIKNPDKLGFFGLLGYKPREIRNFNVFEIDQNLNYKRITIEEFQKVYDNYIQNNK